MFSDNSPRGGLFPMDSPVIKDVVKKQYCLPGTIDFKMVVLRKSWLVKANLHCQPGWTPGRIFLKKFN